MRAFWAMLFALTLTAPSLVLAEAAHGEAVAHEVTEEAIGHDAHDDGHGELTFSSLIRNRDFQGTVINFLVLVGLIVWIIRKKGNPALAARRAEVAETAMRLEKLDEEMVQIRGEMIKAGEAERDRIVEQAEEKAARLRKDTGFLIEQQIKQLRKELTQEAASAAVVAAQELLQERTTDADQDQLAEAYLSRLDEVIEERQS
jgi:F-type H+-transporting ATPase subunit b